MKISTVVINDIITAAAIERVTAPNVATATVTATATATATATIFDICKAIATIHVVVTRINLAHVIQCPVVNITPLLKAELKFSLFAV